MHIVPSGLLQQGGLVYSVHAVRRKHVLARWRDVVHIVCLPKLLVVSELSHMLRHVLQLRQHPYCRCVRQVPRKHVQ